jgi:hypothetical protein
MTTDSASRYDHSYEAPTLVEVGSVRNLTQGNLFSPGQDSLSWIPVIGKVFGS